MDFGVMVEKLLKNMFFVFVAGQEAVFQVGSPM